MLDGRLAPTWPSSAPVDRLLVLHAYVHAPTRRHAEAHRCLPVISRSKTKPPQDASPARLPTLKCMMSPRVSQTNHRYDYDYDYGMSGPELCADFPLGTVNIAQKGAPGADTFLGISWSDGQQTVSGALLPVFEKSLSHPLVESLVPSLMVEDRGGDRGVRVAHLGSGVADQTAAAVDQQGGIWLKRSCCRISLHPCPLLLLS